jgi:hypothetical protein
VVRISPIIRIAKENYFRHKQKLEFTFFVTRIGVEIINLKLLPFTLNGSVLWDKIPLLFREKPL